jgi:tetratricopeptide (TPR) repeat protein
MTNSWEHIIYRLIFITVLLLAVYGNTLNHGFVWDDFNIIVESPLTEKLSNIPKLFITEDTADGSPTGYYRPITYVSFALDRALWGLNPVGFNITNLILHILVVLLFYRVVAALFKRENLALVAALIFSLHPIAGETVNFHAGGRNTLLCAGFALLSLLFYIKNRHIPAILCFTLAIFSKEFALLLPAVFFLYDRRINREKTKWIYYIPYIVSAVCYLGARSLVVTNGNLLKTVNISDNFWIVPHIVISYLKNMIFPIGLKTLYDIHTPVTWSSFITYSVLLCGLIGVVLFFRKKNELLLSASMYFLFLLPVTNIFYLGSARMADRYAYFALFGFSLALAYCICLARNQLVIPIMVVVCLFFMALDIKRNSFWKDEISLFTQMIQDAPELCVGFQNLGVAYYDKQDFANAEKYLTLAYSKKGLSSTMLVGSTSMFLEMNRPGKAITVLEMKIRYEPNNPQPYIMLSRIYEEMGNKAMATLYKDKAIVLYPGIFEIMKTRAIAACRQGERLMSNHLTVRAELLFKEALQIDPFFVPALIDMGSLSAEKGDMTKSLHYFTRAAALDPLNPTPHYNLSMVYESLGNPEKARDEMNQFNELKVRSK